MSLGVNSLVLYSRNLKQIFKMLSRLVCPTLITITTFNSPSQMTAKSLPRLDEDTRLVPILTNLSQGFLAGVPSEWSASSAEGNGEEIRAEMVDDLSRKHFPLCMRNLHESLRRDHHLKHFGRLQYGLFLKVLIVIP